MCRHHLGCPPDGYLGSDYGSDVKAILQSPMAAGLADGVIAKMQRDVPLLRTAAPGTVNLYAQDLDLDKKAIVLEIGGELVPVDGGTDTVVQQEVPSGDLKRSALDSISQVAADTLETLTNITLPGMGFPSQDYF